MSHSSEPVQSEHIFAPKTLRENSFSSGYSWIHLLLTHTMKSQFSCRLQCLCLLFCALSISLNLWMNSCRNFRNLWVLPQDGLYHHRNLASWWFCNHHFAVFFLERVKSDRRSSILNRLYKACESVASALLSNKIFLTNGTNYDL